MATSHVTDTELDEYVIDVAESEGEGLLFGELVLYIERYHPDDRPGVDRELLEGYIENLAAKNVFGRDAEFVFAQIDERTADSETWVKKDAFYRVGTDRISNFPKRWHERVDAADDLRTLVKVLTEDIETSPHGTDTGGKGTGVPQQLLLDAATVLADYDRDDAKTELEEWRDRGELVMDADMHREGRVQLSE